MQLQIGLNKCKVGSSTCLQIIEKQAFELLFLNPMDFVC